MHLFTSDYDDPEGVRTMQRCFAILVALTFITAGMLAWSASPASAAGCGTAFIKVGAPATYDNGNLLGGVHSVRTQARTYDCAGYDLVDYYDVRMDKQNGRCSNGTLVHVNNYDFNPDSLAGYNPGTRTVDCVSGKTTYTVRFNPPGLLRIDNEDSAAARTLGGAWQIDKGPVIGDYNGRFRNVEWNGK